MNAQLAVTEVNNGMKNCASVQVINLVGIMVYGQYGLFGFDTGGVSFQFGILALVQYILQGNVIITKHIKQFVSITIRNRFISSGF
jgi:hypothetical protein